MVNVYILLLLPLSCLSAPAALISNPLQFARETTSRYVDIVNSGGNLLPFIQEYFNEDATLENPAGSTPRRGHAELASTDHLGKVHHVSVYIIEAMYTKESDTMALYYIVSVHLNDCHTSFPVIQLSKYKGEKVAWQKNYWDPSHLCGAAAPWNQGADAVQYSRERYRRLAEVLNEGKDLAGYLEQHITEDATCENPVGAPIKQGVKQIADLSGYPKLLHFSATPVEVIRTVDPNTLATYHITTYQFKNCYVTTPVLGLVTLKGDKVLSRKTYWDTSAFEKCASKKEL